MKPNIIYIHTHDMGRYIGTYVHGLQTPAMDRFAERSTTFRHAYCCGPTCSPSRAGLLTGESPHQAGMLGLAHRGFFLNQPQRHLGAFLKTQGYKTALFGIQHEFQWKPEDMPYDIAYTDTPERDHKARDEASAERTCRYLQEEHMQPFFLSFGLFYPHRAFMKADEAKYPQADQRPPAPLPDVPEVRQDMADYAHTVNFTDQCIGRVLQTLEAGGYFKNSIIILTTDHGIAFPGMKCSLTDHGIGVALMLHYPGNPCAGLTVDSLVSHLDVYPTLCELIDAPRPAHLQGHSLLPILNGTTREVRQEIFSEVTFHAAYEPKRCIRTREHKLIMHWPPLSKPLANCDDSLSKDYLLGHGKYPSRSPEITLYDLALDPQEKHNLAGNSGYRKIQDDLTERLFQWMQATEDPLIEGSVSRPPWAIVNTLEAISSSNGPYEPKLEYAENA